MAEGDIGVDKRAIEQVKTLGEIVSSFLAKICDSPAFEAGHTSINEIADRLAVDIAAALAGRYPSQSTHLLRVVLRHTGHLAPKATRSVFSL